MADSLLDHVASGLAHFACFALPAIRMHDAKQHASRSDAKGSTLPSCRMARGLKLSAGRESLGPLGCGPLLAAAIREVGMNRFKLNHRTSD